MLIFWYKRFLISLSACVVLSRSPEVSCWRVYRSGTVFRQSTFALYKVSNLFRRREGVSDESHEWLLCWAAERRLLCNSDLATFLGQEGRHWRGFPAAGAALSEVTFALYKDSNLFQGSERKSDESHEWLLDWMAERALSPCSFHLLYFLVCSHQRCRRFVVWGSRVCAISWFCLQGAFLYVSLENTFCGSDVPLSPRTKNFHFDG